MRAVLVLSVVLAIAAASTVARAVEKRPVPDYDGRGPPPSPNAIVWVPRIILSPVYLVSEFGLRRPLAVVVPAVEKADLPRKTYDFFVFGPHHSAGVVPVGFVSFGFQPSVGAYGFWNDSFFVKDTALRVHAEMWPTGWFHGSMTERIHFAGPHVLQFRASGSRRPDRVFYGIGPSSMQSHQSRFTEARFDGSMKLELALGGSSHLDTALGVRKVDTSNGDMRPDPTIEESVAAGWFPAPYGFRHVYTTGWTRVGATLDTRPRALESSGVRAEMFSESATEVNGGGSWLRYGASATASVDLTRRHEVLSISVATLFADPVGNASIPFTELVAFGGDHLMRGFFPGRFVDRSGAVATLRYDWPIGPWIGGTLQLSAGNVFGTHLERFRPELLRLSMVAGFSIRGLDPPVEMVFGFGTDTLERGATIESGRFSLGVPYDFF